MLTGKTKGLGLDIPQALLFFSISFFSRSCLNRPAHCCQVSRPDWENTLHIKGVAQRVFLCVFVCLVNSFAILPSFRSWCIIVVRNAAQVTSTFDGCEFCADRSECLPRRGCVLAPECLWKYLFCTDLGRDRRGEGWERQTVFAHVKIVGLSSS